MPAEERRRREALYRHGGAAWPVGAQAWRAAAAEVLARNHFDWIEGGAGEEWTLEANREAFKRWRLRPRMLAGNSSRDLGVDVLGTRCPAPFMLAPIGGQTVVHPEGELATARAAAAAEIPMVVSTAASHRVEDVAGALGDAPRWYQLYWVSDQDVTQSFLRRAVSVGCEAIVLTIDSPRLGWRDRDLRNAYNPHLEGHGIGQYTSDPVFRSRLARPPEEDERAAGAAMVKMFPNASLTWNHLAWLREQTRLPLLVKGVLTAEDARLARDTGMDGGIVSNHGARQLDGEVAALDALPEVRDELGPDATILVDSGIRRGTDIVKALALGADAVLVGRPYLYGLAVGGDAGVAQVLRALAEEVDLALGLVGAHGATSVDRSFVTEAPR
jgi:lactate 2-monooxygenase